MKKEVDLCLSAGKLQEMQKMNDRLPVDEKEKRFGFLCQESL